jgi:hypothetical protein
MRLVGNGGMAFPEELTLKREIVTSLPIPIQVQASGPSFVGQAFLLAATIKISTGKWERLPCKHRFR